MTAEVQPKTRSEKIQEILSGDKSAILALDQTGDTKTTWDPNVVAEVEEARRTFNNLKSKGYAAHKVEGDGSKGEVIRDFDPTAKAIIMSPQMAGG